MPFEVFTQDTITAKGDAYISIQKKGILALNRSAYAELGEPTAVELLYDKERQLVGVRAADKGVQHARKVRLSSNRATFLVSTAQFTHHYGIDTSTGRRWPAQLVDDVLCIDIGKPPVQ